jgi:hypothetical protein
VAGDFFTLDVVALLGIACTEFSVERRAPFMLGDVT